MKRLPEFLYTITLYKPELGLKVFKDFQFHDRNQAIKCFQDMKDVYGSTTDTVVDFQIEETNFTYVQV